MDRRAVVKFFTDEFLKSLDVLWRDVRIKLDHDAAIVSGFDYRNLRVRGWLDACLEVRAARFSRSRILSRVVALVLVTSGQRKKQDGKKRKDCACFFHSVTPTDQNEAIAFVSEARPLGRARSASKALAYARASDTLRKASDCLKVSSLAHR